MSKSYTQIYQKRERRSIVLRVFGAEFELVLFETGQYAEVALRCTEGVLISSFWSEEGGKSLRC
jgi:hypothetical protein